MWYFFKGRFIGSVESIEHSYYMKFQSDSRSNAALQAENTLMKHAYDQSSKYGELVDISIDNIKAEEYYGMSKQNVGDFLS